MKKQLDEVIAAVDAIGDALRALRDEMPDLIAVGDVVDLTRVHTHLSRHLHAKADGGTK